MYNLHAGLGAVPCPAHIDFVHAAREDARPPRRQLHPGGRASPRAAIMNPIWFEQEKDKVLILHGPFSPCPHISSPLRKLAKYRRTACSACETCPFSTSGLSRDSFTNCCSRTSRESGFHFSDARENQEGQISRADFCLYLEPSKNSASLPVIQRPSFIKDKYKI